MRAAIIDGTTVVNVIELDPDSDFDPGQGLTLAELEEGEEVGPGWSVANGSYQQPDPVAPEPSTIDLLQAQVDQLADLLLELL